MPKSFSQLLTLITVRLVDGRVRRFQNSQAEALTFRLNRYEYFNFTMPALARTIGEKAETVSILLPNVGASEYGYFPLREWVQDGTLDNALIVFEVFDYENTLYQHSLIIAEKVVQQQDRRGIVELRLRQPDDRYAAIMTAVYNYKTIGESPTYSAF